MTRVVRAAARRRWVVAALVGAGTVLAAAVPSRSADVAAADRPAAYAVTGATVHTGVGPAVKDGTVVVRDGVIAAVGPAAKVAVPADAETIDGAGLHVYPGFLDLYATIGVPAGATRSRTGEGRTPPVAELADPRTPADNRNGLTPEFEVAAVLDLADAMAAERRRQGFTAVVAAPGGAIASGQSALVSLAGQPRREAVIQAPVALHVALRRPGGLPFLESAACADDDPPKAETPPAEPTGRRRGGGGPATYPTSLMGVVAHLRQAMLDAEYHLALTAHVAKHGGPRPPYDPALDALHAARSKVVPVWWEANSRDEIHRALDLAEEFGTSAVIVGGREAWKVADRLKALGVPVVLRVDLPDEPKVPAREAYLKASPEDRDAPIAVLEDRKARWTERAACAAALAKAGVRFAFTADGLTRVDTFHDRVGTLVAAGLPADAAVAALTRDAAAVAGQSKRLGTIEPGKLGHLVALSAAYGDSGASVRYVLADGLKFEPNKDKDKNRNKTANKEAADSGRVAPARPAAAKAAVKAAQAAEAVPKEKGAAKEKGAVAAKEARKPADAPKAAVEPSKSRNVPAAAPPAPAPGAARPTGEEDRGPAEPFVDVASETAAARRPAVRTGRNAFIRGARVLTVTRGVVEKGNVLIADGKIEAVGPDVAPRPGVAVIDGEGLVAAPGFVDTHSHMAIQGGVNETSLSVVPEVRVKDVVNGDDPALYRALAGGTTTARLLHGSADAVGGQDAVIKLKHGLAGRDLVVTGAPRGVKFALGENVTRRGGRFPNTRMGVESTIERAFAEANAYRDARRAVGRGEAGRPFRRDLRLEALADVLDGDLKIHCHCYRSDEILMLLRLAERHGVKVRSLQHVLEGYKVAPEIAAHGASASTFSDWWAYKVEAYDAIPFNAALLTRAGVSVCIKSDSPELVRHLNLEAAKTVKYGGATPDQALAMITINPARELGLESRLGSIEPGKDADVVLFNGHPLDATSRCELAMIDGEVWFQRRPTADAPGVPPKERPRATLPAPPAAAGFLDIPTNPKGVYALTGATVHPVAGPAIPGGTVVVSGATVAAVGGRETPIPPGATTVDARGLDVWPGMVDAGCPLGLAEIGSLPETQDSADSARFQPELRAAAALHPDSEWIPVTRANGVLAAYVQPGGGLIAGQGCVVQLDGWVPPEMTLLDRAALNVNVPAFTPDDPDAPRRAGAEDPNRQRKEQLDAIKEQFLHASTYDRSRKAAAARKETPPAPNPRLEALAPYARGERLVILRADRRVEILDAIRLASDLKLKAAVTGGAEAWKVARELKASGLPVLVAGTLSIPGRPTDPYDACYANPARLHAAGVPFAIRSVGRGPDQATAPRNLPYEAATAAAFGLPLEEAVKAVTVSPAQILGVGDRLGTIEPGKRANLVVTAGHLLQPTTEVKALFIGGRPLPPESRHTRLFATYTRRLDAVKSGAAPLGLDRPNASAVAPVPAAPAPARATAPGPAGPAR